MEPKFQSSFIPKGPVAQAGSVAKFSRVSDRTILGTLAVFVFSFTILLSLGVFGYQLYLQSRIGKMGGDLALARQSLEPETIKKISDLNGRIVSTKTLLEKHVVLSPLFDYLESSTVKNLRFIDFSYEAGEKGLVVTMRGSARGYSVVALQSHVFQSRGSPFKDAVFSDLNLDDKGNVNFTFKAEVDPSVVSYEKQVSSQPPTFVPAPVVVPPASSSSSTSATTTQ